MPDLRTYIIEQQAANWEKLGLKLGLEQHLINMFSKDNSHNPNRSADCCKAVLQRWLDDIPSPTWGKLNDAIKEIQLPTIRLDSTDKGGNHGHYYNVLLANTC